MSRVTPKLSRLCAAALTWTTIVCAPGTGLADPAAGEALFREGRRLIAEGRIAEACDKFAESQRLDPSSGAVFNLATCHAELGKSATAWAEFLLAARMARAQQRAERADEALARAAEIEPRLLRLAVRVSAPVVGLRVTRNGEELAPSALETAIPVDPGTYEIRTVAPGYSEWSTRVTLSAPGETRVVDVPSLVPLPSAPPASPALPEPPASRSVKLDRPYRATPPRALPAGFWISSALGAAALATGGVTLGLSLNSYNKAESVCPTHQGCGGEAMTAWDRAQTQADVATVAFGTALAAAAVSVWLYLSNDATPARPQKAHELPPKNRQLSRVTSP